MKKGFTLIELMVVIVIMGALAAIGVPKLFGVIAKAKASEIHTAAGTYIHLQDAYLANKPGPGSWKDIGYGAPGNGSSKNFCYNSGNLESAVLISEIPENTIGWGVSNLSSLNECSAGSWWSIVITQQGEHDLNYSKNVNNAVCGNLTNSWNVGTTLTGNCESTNVNEVKKEEPSEEPSNTPAEKPAEETKTEPTETPKDETPKEEPKTETTTTTPPPASVQEAQKNIDNAKKAYTSHKGGQSDEEGKALKKAWEDAVKQCEETFGKKNCNANGSK